MTSLEPGVESEAVQTTAEPSITVVIPVYNVAAFVGQCVASVAAQTRRPSEVLLIDDRGTDDSIAVAERELRRHSLAWRRISHPANRGLGAARNTGIAEAAGDLVWFLDSDDTAEPLFLETMTRALAAQRADLAVCRTMRVDLEGRRLGIDEQPYGGGWVDGTDFARGLLHDRFRAYACNKLFRRSLLPSGMFDEGRSYEDFVPILRLALQSKRIALVDEPLYRYTSNPNSISTRFGVHTADLFEVGRDVQKTLFRAGRHDEWRRDAAVYRALNVVMPVANTALRAQHGGDDSALATSAMLAARRELRAGDLMALLTTGRARSALALSVLKASPTLYARMLKSR